MGQQVGRADALIASPGRVGTPDSGQYRNPEFFQLGVPEKGRAAASPVRIDFLLLRQLDAARIAFELKHSRDDAILVSINVPGERWDVEFLEDGDIEIERFTSDGEIYGATLLADLFARFSDEEPARHKGRATA